MEIKQFLQRYSTHDGDILTWVQREQAWFITLDCFDHLWNRATAELCFEEVRNVQDDALHLLNISLEQGLGVGVLLFEIQDIPVGFRVRIFLEITNYLVKEQSYLTLECECQRVRVLRVGGEIGE